MVGSTWVLGWSRVVSLGPRAAYFFAGAVCVMASCSPAQSNISPPSDGTGGFVGAGPAGPGFVKNDPPCVAALTATPVFADQVFSSTELFGREFYSWTTDEQAFALRQDPALFSQAAAPGTPFTLLSALSYPPALAQLAQTLSLAFALGRYAWPEPWAARMDRAGRDPGGQLVRIVIKPDAWLAVIGSQSLSVFDAQRQSVPVDDAQAHPDRIGVFYYDSTLLDPNGCISPQGERGFLLGNLGMVEQWSIGTQQIDDRITSNIAQLTRYLDATRSCPVTTDTSAWAQSVICSWQMQLSTNNPDAGDSDMGAGGVPSAGGSAPDAGPDAPGAGAAAFASGGSTSVAGGFNSGGSTGTGGAFTGTGGAARSGFNPADFGGLQAPSSEEFAYDQALAVPSASYLAAPAQIASIIQTLQGDLFEPDPLVVTPGSP